eukprot:CAMPEP_0205869380 /NCGR_PEP_ID=MMETSP1083-20121108/9981_1 /ASSEMBLY_ACC=CAM_ASM_000430 /TAXON_ID=97485 /ORGANISM="Prymnesium parvum, Strain Texoma1" /LENGTH=32 /DNA_ID= /DNA_START= /DNA_END= /DNA_ORIENTATION=
MKIEVKQFLVHPTKSEVSVFTSTSLYLQSISK